MSEDLNKLDYIEYDSFQISYLIEEQYDLFFLFIHDLSDNFNMIKKALIQCKQSFIDLFEEYLPDKLDMNIIQKFNAEAYKIQNLLPPKIALVGYYGVGKTTTSELLRTHKIPIIKDPTISAEIATLKISNINFSFWDYKGQEDFIFLWKNFISDSNLIFLITDSTLGNVDKSKFFLKLVNEELPGTNIIAFANKQDLKGALNTEQIQNMLGIDTYPLIATDHRYRYEIIKILLEKLEVNEEILKTLNKFTRRERIIKDLEDLIEKKNFKVAKFLFEQAIKITKELGEIPHKLEFYKLQDKIESFSYKEEGPEQMIPPQKQLMNEKNIPIVEQNLKKLLRNYMKQVEEIIGVIICDRDGFIITSESKAEEDNLVLGAIAVAVDSFIERIKNEFGDETKFFNTTTVGDKKFSYCSVGKKSILLTISMPTAIENELKVYSEHIAGKVELLLEGNENVSLEIPHIVKILSKTRDGTIPAGKYTTKLILTGDYSVGKTSLILRFVKNLFKDTYQSTVGVEISQKDLEIETDVNIRFVIWDIGGQITQMAPYRGRFYEGATTAFIVIDRTRTESLKSADLWYGEIKKFVDKDINIILVGNKSDLLDQIVITEQDIKQVADKYNFHYILSSAKTGENVNEAFTYIAYDFLKSFIS